jgi:hypothetical protein
MRTGKHEIPNPSNLKDGTLRWAEAHGLPVDRIADPITGRGGYLADPPKRRGTKCTNRQPNVKRKELSPNSRPGLSQKRKQLKG